MDDSSLKKGKLTQLDSLSFKQKLRIMATISKNSIQKDNNSSNLVSHSKTRSLAAVSSLRPGCLDIPRHEKTQSARGLISASKKCLSKIPRSRGNSPGTKDSNLSISGSSRGSSPTWMHQGAIQGSTLSEEKQKQKIEQVR